MKLPIYSTYLNNFRINAIFFIVVYSEFFQLLFRFDNMQLPHLYHVSRNMKDTFMELQILIFLWKFKHFIQCCNKTVQHLDIYRITMLGIPKDGFKTLIIWLYELIVAVIYPLVINNFRSRENMTYEV